MAERSNATVSKTVVCLWCTGGSNPPASVFNEEERANPPMADDARVFLSGSEERRAPRGAASENPPSGGLLAGESSRLRIEKMRIKSYNEGNLRLTGGIK